MGSSVSLEGLFELPISKSHLEPVVLRGQPSCWKIRCSTIVQFGGHNDDEDLFTILHGLLKRSGSKRPSGNEAHNLGISGLGHRDSLGGILCPLQTEES